MFRRITIALERIADNLESLVKEYRDQKQEQKNYMEAAKQERENLPSFLDIFKQVQGGLERTPERRQIKNGD